MTQWSWLGSVKTQQREGGGLGTTGEIRFRKHGAAIEYLAMVGWRIEGVSLLKEVQGAWVQSLVGELDPTFMLQLGVHMPQLRSAHAATKKSACHNKDPACRN